MAASEIFTMSGFRVYVREDWRLRIVSDNCFIYLTISKNWMQIVKFFRDAHYSKNYIEFNNDSWSMYLNYIQDCWHLEIGTGELSVVFSISQDELLDFANWLEKKYRGEQMKAYDCWWLDWQAKPTGEKEFKQAVQPSFSSASDWMHERLRGCYSSSIKQGEAVFYYSNQRGLVGVMSPCK